MLRTVRHPGLSLLWSPTLPLWTQTCGLVFNGRVSISRRAYSSGTPSSQPFPPSLPSAPIPIRPAPLTITCRPGDSPFAAYRGLERNEKLTSFYAAVLAAEPGPLCPTSGTRMWRLWSPDDHSQPFLWPFLKTHVLVERDFYRDFLAQSQWLGDFLRSPDGGGEVEQRKCAVLGQPGIGKSSFGLWLIAQLLKRGRSVVYTRNTARAGATPELSHFVFHDHVAFKTDSPELSVLDKFLAHQDVIHISDSKAPRMVDDCHQVLITSPDPNVWLWYVEKEMADAVYFPLYSLEEMEALRSAEYGSTISAEILALRIRAWGLIPRAVFSRKQVQMLESIESAMAGASFETLNRAFKEVSAGSGAMSSTAPHSLFVVHADRLTLKKGELRFRSGAVAARIAYRLANDDYSALLKAMQQLLSSNSTRILAGQLFEAAAIDYLAGGGRFKVRALLKRQEVKSGSGPAQASLPKVKARGKRGSHLEPAISLVDIPQAKLTVRFSSLADLEHALGSTTDAQLHRFIPFSRTFAAIDSIEPGLRAMQYTVSPKHKLKVTSGGGKGETEGLLPFARAFLPRITPSRQSPYLEVFFVIPTDSGAILKEPQTLTWSDPSQGTVVEVPAAGKEGWAHLGFQETGKGEVVEVRQFVLEMEPKVLCDRLVAKRELDDLDRAASTSPTIISKSTTSQ